MRNLIVITSNMNTWILGVASPKVGSFIGSGLPSTAWWIRRCVFGLLSKFLLWLVYWINCDVFIWWFCNVFVMLLCLGRRWLRNGWYNGCLVVVWKKQILHFGDGWELFLHDFVKLDFGDLSLMFILFSICFSLAHAGNFCTCTKKNLVFFYPHFGDG